MAVNLHIIITMKKTVSIFLSMLILLTACKNLDAQVPQKNSFREKMEERTILYFAPEISPYVEEIKDATYDSFFSAVTDRFAKLRNHTLLTVNTPISYENTDAELIRDMCKNNNAHFAVVPKVKFFKVGIGQFVFSSQVVVSMKLYDADGNMLSENTYDTFRRKARVLGSAENSIKIGTNGVLKNLVKDLKKQKTIPN